MMNKILVSVISIVMCLSPVTTVFAGGGGASHSGSGGNSGPIIIGGGGSGDNSGPIKISGGGSGGGSGGNEPDKGAICNSVIFYYTEYTDETGRTEIGEDFTYSLNANDNTISVIKDKAVEPKEGYTFLGWKFNNKILKVTEIYRKSADEKDYVKTDEGTAVSIPAGEYIPTLTPETKYTENNGVSEKSVTVYGTVGCGIYEATAVFTKTPTEPPKEEGTTETPTDEPKTPPTDTDNTPVVDKSEKEQSKNDNPTKEESKNDKSTKVANNTKEQNKPVDNQQKGEEPQTGDNMNVIPYVVLSVVSVGCVLLLVRKNRGEKRKL